MFTQRTKVGAVLIALCFTLVVCKAGRTRQTPATARRVTTLAYEPAPDRGMPLVRVRLSNGVQHQAVATFILDTGFTQCLMTDRLARLLHLDGEPALRDDGTPVSFGDGRPLQQVTTAMQISDLAPSQRSFVLLKAYRLDLLDCPLDGVLGWDFLSDYAVLFDFQAHTVTLWRGGDLSASELRGAGMEGAIVLPRANKTPGSFDIAVRLNDQADVNLAVDTGGAHTLLDIAQARLLELRPTRLGFRQPSVFGDLKANEARLSALVFGGLRVSDLPVRYLQSPHPNLPPHLGLDVLTHYRMLIDYPARKLYLKPTKTP